MRRLKFGLVFLILGLAIAYGLYLIRLTNAGYCFAAEKYLTDEEKIKAALVDLLKKYPPSVFKKLQRPDVLTMSVPPNPIYYRDVDEFLSLNPDCCKFIAPSKFMESDGNFTLIERLTGAATNLIEVNYVVRYRGEDRKVQTIKTTGYLYITSCGTPGHPPYTP